MATITIQRSNEYNNMLRDYQIYLDGENVGTLANGETRDFHINAGQHTLQAKIDWCSSPVHTLNLTENESKIFLVSGFQFGRWLIRLSGGIIILHFIISSLYKIYFVGLLALPALLLFVYYLTLGRNKYLTLSEG